MFIIHIKKHETPTKKNKRKLFYSWRLCCLKVPGRSLNQSLKEYFSIVISFSGAITQDMKGYINPTIPRGELIGLRDYGIGYIFHIGYRDLRCRRDMGSLPF